jgi:hypothetical protein
VKDVGPGVSVRKAREGERRVPDDLPERELTRGWLRASYRGLDEERSRPGEPFRRLTREAIEAAGPGAIIGYQVQILVPTQDPDVGARSGRIRRSGGRLATLGEECHGSPDDGHSPPRLAPLPQSANLAQPVIANLHSL